MNIKTIEELKKEYGAIDLMIATKDRHTETTLLIQSLRSQTYNKFNILLLDDASGTPINGCGFFMALMNRIKMEGHLVKLGRNNVSHGVCQARNSLIDTQLNFNTGAKLCLRLDDDVILEPDYLERLIRVIYSGYDMSSGVVPLIMQPDVKRQNKFIGKIINEHKLDEEGKLAQNNDDCGHTYLEEGIFPTHQFRTNCMYKVEVHKKVRYPENLTPVGFREEGFFSMKAILEGFTIGVDIQAQAYHFQTASGGVRRPDYNDCVQLDDETFRKFLKTQFDEHGNFIEKYNQKLKNEGLLK